MKTGPKPKTGLEKKAGVYRIQNLVTGKFYIGSSVNILQRYWHHRTDMKRGVHKNPGIKKDTEKYGIDSFVFGVVEYCDKNELITKEQDYLNLWNPIYNRRLDVDNPKSQWDDNARKNIGEKLKIAWIARKSRPGFREKHAAARRGILHNEETKKKLSEMRKGKRKSSEWIEKFRQRRMGTKLINGKFIKNSEVF